MSADRSHFLQSLGLPAAWAAKPRWCILDTRLGAGERFLAAWQAWRSDPQRSRMLHYVAIEPAALSASDWQHRSGIADIEPVLAPLAEELQAQCFGLLPGFHRLVFEGGRVLLTICVGEIRAVLRELQFQADAVYLPDVATPKDAAPPRRTRWDPWVCKALARCCRRGTLLVAEPETRAEAQEHLMQAGFVPDQRRDLPPTSARPQWQHWYGRFDPAWTPKKRLLNGTAHASPYASAPPGRCAVIGAGLAGAAVAASLARRGWLVDVLDSAQTPAAGASGLPVGLLAPHTSSDDGVLSRLSRSGIRLTQQQVRMLLREGTDWHPTGLLERRVGSRGALPTLWPAAGQDWTQAASTTQLTEAGLGADTPALWHTQAAWIKPACLVRALLSEPGIAWHGNSPVAALAPRGSGWQSLDANRRVLAEADIVVIAAGFASQVLLTASTGKSPPLQAIRGQLSYGDQTINSPVLPPFPVNGNGHLTPQVPFGPGKAWFVGASYGRDDLDISCRAQDHEANLERLKNLLPEAARQLQAEFSSDRVQAWVGLRCASPDRLPLLGPTCRPGLWVCTAMGSRGLTMAVLCGELLAAWLHGEPLPVERSLARRLLPSRFSR